MTKISIGFWFTHMIKFHVLFKKYYLKKGFKMSWKDLFSKTCLLRAFLKYRFHCFDATLSSSSLLQNFAWFFITLTYLYITWSVRIMLNSAWFLPVYILQIQCKFFKRGRIFDNSALLLPYFVTLICLWLLFINQSKFCINLSVFH